MQLNKNKQGRDLPMLKLFVISTLAFSCSINSVKAYAAKPHNLFIGAGYHNREFDCPKFCLETNALVIIDYKYKFHTNWAIKLKHESQPTVKDKGLNSGYIGLDIQF